MRILAFFLLFYSFSFSQNSQSIYCNQQVKVGAERTSEYLSFLTAKKVAIVGNQTTTIGEVHLVDSLLALGIDVVKVFSPEHGFRGKADAGEKVSSGKDEKTGLPIISLYGKNKKPTAEQLKGIDIVIFDIQDVGARFYTYISTMTYVMEACAENNIPILVLDRPNPNGHYVDGPVLKKKFKSFVGMHEVPVVHGMTIGEYAKMVNEEAWLENSVKCELTVIPCEGWNHQLFYKLPQKPSPNLPNMASIYLYPSLCFFEGTVVSIGRGTDYPFQIIGHPLFNDDSFNFTPQSKEGAKNPPLLNEKCFGINLSVLGVDILQKQKQINIQWLLLFYEKIKLNDQFFLSTNFINLLAGSDELKNQILSGKSEKEIRASWEEDLSNFKKMRKKYLLYDDFVD